MVYEAFKELNFFVQLLIFFAGYNIFSIFFKKLVLIGLVEKGQPFFKQKLTGRDQLNLFFTGVGFVLFVWFVAITSR